MSENTLLLEISQLKQQIESMKDMLTALLTSNENDKKLTHYVSISECAKMIGVPYEDLRSKAQNGKIPFLAYGNRNKHVDPFVIKEYIDREANETMEYVKKQIAFTPYDKSKVDLAKRKAREQLLRVDL